MNLIAPNVANLVRGGAIVYFDRGRLGYYTDLGNIPSFSASSPTQFVEHKSARSGAVVMDRREPTEFSNLYKFGIEELNLKNLQLLFNSTAPTTLSQSSSTVGTLTIASAILDVAYELNAHRVTGLVAKRATTVTLTSGTDYILEADLGMISFPAGGAVQIGDALGVGWSQPAITGDAIAPLSNNSAISGAARVWFRTSDGRIWHRKHSNVQMSFGGDTPFSGGEFAKADGELLFMPDYSDPAKPFGTLELWPVAA